MNVEGIDGQFRLPLRKSIEIDVSHNVAGRAAIGVLEDSLQIALHGDGGSGEAVEDGDLLRLQSAAEVVGLRRPLEERGEEGDELGHHANWGLQLCHCWSKAGN